MGGGAEVDKPERPTFTSSALAPASSLILVTGSVTNCVSKVLCSTPSRADSVLGCASNDLPCAVHLRKKLPFQHGWAYSVVYSVWDVLLRLLFFPESSNSYSSSILSQGVHLLCIHAHTHSYTHTYFETMPMTTGQLSNINLTLKSINSFHFFVQESSLTTSGQFQAPLVQVPIN